LFGWCESPLFGGNGGLESRGRGRLEDRGGWEPTFEEENAEEAHAEERQEARITAMTTIETPILPSPLLKTRRLDPVRSTPSASDLTWTESGNAKVEGLRVGVKGGCCTHAISSCCIASTGASLTAADVGNVCQYRIRALLDWNLKEEVVAAA